MLQSVASGLMWWFL